MSFAKREYEVCKFLADAMNLKGVKLESNGSITFEYSTGERMVFNPYLSKIIAYDVIFWALSQSIGLNLSREYMAINDGIAKKSTRWWRKAHRDTQDDRNSILIDCIAQAAGYQPS